MEGRWLVEDESLKKAQPHDTKACYYFVLNKKQTRKWDGLAIQCIAFPQHAEVFLFLGIYDSAKMEKTCLVSQVQP